MNRSASAGQHGRRTTPSSPTPLMRLRGITKRFGALIALDGIDLDLYAGSVHGLVGANGAGKSTLGRVIGGVHQPDGGRMDFAGAAIDLSGPGDALRLGIAVIQQEPALVPALSVRQNVFLGSEARNWGFLSGGMDERFEALKARCEFDLPPDTAVRELRIADRQKVEIMRALGRSASIIVMDEPTSALTPDEAEKLHGVIVRLKGDGVAVVYVSHYLEAVLDVADTVTILRSGKLVATTPAGSETPESLVQGMMGSPLGASFPTRSAAPGGEAPIALQVDHLSAGGLVKDVSLELRVGEIVGVAGLVGSGRSELLRAILGADKPDEGRVAVFGRILAAKGPAEAGAVGMVMVPEDRRTQGLIMSMTVAHNVTLPHLLEGLSRWGFVRSNHEAVEVDEILAQLDVTPRVINGDIRLFSGGNQQKILFGKWLLRAPRVILLDEPTRGVDVGAKRAIYKFIVDLAASGAAVLLVSSELEEVLALSHRVYVLHRGEVTAEIDTRSLEMLSADDVLRLAFGLESLVAEVPGGRDSTVIGDG